MLQQRLSSVDGEGWSRRRINRNQIWYTVTVLVTDYFPPPPPPSFLLDTKWVLVTPLDARYSTLSNSRNEFFNQWLVPKIKAIKHK